MDLLQVYRCDSRLISMVETVRNGRTMLLIPSVVDKCVAVFDKYKPDTSSPEYPYMGDECGTVWARLAGSLTGEDFDIEPESRSDFDRILVQTLHGWGIEFAAVLPEQSAVDGARMLNVEDRYRGSKGGVTLGGLPPSPATGNQEHTR